MSCVVCGGDLDLFLDVGDSPLANRYPASPDEPQPRYPLRLGRCARCTLVQMLDVVPDAEIYNDGYGFYSGGSAPQRDYHRRSAQLLLARFGPRFVVEVACNDGSLLQHFADAGCRTLGVDPAAGPVAVARQRGLDVVGEPLTAALAKDIRAEHGPAGLVVAYNSMAHVADLPDVLTAVRTLMDGGSRAVFEVAYLPDTVAGNAYDQCYHEHRFFYSLTSLEHACRAFGLYVADAELIDLQNGGLRVTVCTDATVVPSAAVARIAAAETWLATFTGFQGLVDRTRDHLLDLLAEQKAQGRRIGGYGAAAKATTILNFCHIDADVVEFVADQTPYKQGRYMPGTAIPIVADAQADVLLLLAANYLGTVLRSHPHRGPWIVPQPVPAVL